MVILPMWAPTLISLGFFSGCFHKCSDILFILQAKFCDYNGTVPATTYVHVYTYTHMHIHNTHKYTHACTYTTHTHTHMHVHNAHVNIHNTHTHTHIVSVVLRGNNNSWLRGCILLTQHLAYGNGLNPKGSTQWPLYKLHPYTASRKVTQANKQLINSWHI